MINIGRTLEGTRQNCLELGTIIIEDIKKNEGKNSIVYNTLSDEETCIELNSKQFCLSMSIIIMISIDKLELLEKTNVISDRLEEISIEFEISINNFTSTTSSAISFDLPDSNTPALKYDKNISNPLEEGSIKIEISTSSIISKTLNVTEIEANSFVSTELVDRISSELPNRISLSSKIKNDSLMETEVTTRQTNKNIKTSNMTTNNDNFIIDSEKDVVSNVTPSYSQRKEQERGQS
ncbi:hypothetical protein SNEBB_005818 [Seison nebaliae]|nr:hypothetical protein SNEBB_005818 [Seison nebaliae]